MDRREQLLSMLDASGFGLEIGPSYNPLLPKAEGYNVETIDYADQAELIRKYASNATVDASRIEAVDYVSDGRPMVEVIGAEGRYDFIVASHVIEHTPDMIGFLEDCDRLLKPGGVLALAVPDKRCCFDVFQRLSSTGEILEAHRLGRSRPGYGSVFDEVAYGVKQDGSTGWPKGSKGDRCFVQTVQGARDVATRAETSGVYTDVHVWRFVPSSFELILNDLYEVGAVRLRIEGMHVADEFLVALSRTGKGPARSRLDMMAAASEEQAFEQVAEERKSIHRLSDETAELRAEVARLRQELDGARGMLSAGDPSTPLGAELRAIRSHCDSVVTDLEAIRASPSWKITAPLRSAVARFRS